MIIDFQHHYTPRSLVEPRLNNGDKSLIYTGGAPSYILHPLLWDLDEHVRMMDAAGIDAAMLSSGAAMDAADLEVCQFVNDDLARVERAYPGRFFGLAHAPATGGQSALDELSRCVQELGFRGVVTTTYPQQAHLDDPRLDAYWEHVQRLGVYVFVHPALVPPGLDYMQDYDLLRSMGREFSLAMETVRLVNGGVLDRFPELRVLFAHLSGGISTLLGRVRGYQDKQFWATAGDPRHGRLPDRDFMHYVRERLYYDTGGFCGEINAVTQALVEIPASRIVFATDYPQEIRDADLVRGFVEQIRALGADGTVILDGSGAALVPALTASAR